MEGPLIHYVLTEPIDTPKTDSEIPPRTLDTSKRR